MVEITTVAEAEAAGTVEEVELQAAGLTVAVVDLVSSIPKKTHPSLKMTVNGY